MRRGQGRFFDRDFLGRWQTAGVGEEELERLASVEFAIRAYLGIDQRRGKPGRDHSSTRARGS